MTTQPQASGAPVAGEGLTIGDYVLATKYHDGDPGDPWALGFYAGTLPPLAPPLPGSHLVNDSSGKSIRAGGFRRVGKVSEKMGAWLLNVAAPALEQCPPGTVNLWKLLDPNEGQPHRSEPDQGDSRARFEAWVLSDLRKRHCWVHIGKCGDTYADPFVQSHWITWQASEQRSAGAVGEPVADFYLVVGPIEDGRPGTSVETGYATDLAESDNGDSFAYDMCQSHINEAVEICVAHGEPAPEWKVIPVYRAAPTASGDARDAARYRWLRDECHPDNLRKLMTGCPDGTGITAIDGERT